MNEQTEQSDKSQKIANNSHGLQKWLWPIISLLLLGGGAYIWWWQQQNVNNLSSKINELNSQIEARPTEEQPPAVINDPASTYTAKVGKFTLTLADYAIVVLHDAGAEGSPYTSLLIANKTTEPGVVTSNTYSNAKLTAVQYGLNNTTLDKAVALNLGNSSRTKLPSVTIDGVTAEVYKIDGLDYTKKVFFGKGDTLYIIELTFIDETTEKMLEAIIKGFTFN